MSCEELELNEKSVQLTMGDLRKFCVIDKV